MRQAEEIGTIVYVKEDIWKSLIKEAKQKPKPLKPFFMFTERGEGLPFKVIEFKEVPFKMIRERSPSGPIFRWDIKKDQRDEYYPKGDIRYSGTTLIQPHLKMTLHYAYFMAIDFGHYGGFNINLWARDGKSVYKAYFVGASKTDGEFVRCEVKTF